MLASASGAAASIVPLPLCCPRGDEIVRVVERHAERERADRRVPRRLDDKERITGRRRLEAIDLIADAIGARQPEPA